MFEKASPATGNGPNGVTPASNRHPPARPSEIAQFSGVCSILHRYRYTQGPPFCFLLLGPGLRLLSAQLAEHPR